MILYGFDREGTCPFRKNSFQAVGETGFTTLLFMRTVTYQAAPMSQMETILARQTDSL